MPLILGANSVSGYTVKNSLRFNSGSSDNLTKAFASAGNRQKFTLSFWVKLSSVGANGFIWGDVSNGNFLQIFINSNSQFQVYDQSVSLQTWSVSVYRDVSAWYHFVVAFDSTQATTSNRMKVYVNNVQQDTSTWNVGAGNNSYPSLNSNLGYNTTNVSSFGRTDYGYFSGYLSEFYMIDGQQLDATSFGETDEDTGIWKPKAYTGTFGTNGFYLDFEDSANLGNDMSGNNNDFTVNNLTSIDQTTDTPTNNFCTMSPLIQFKGSGVSQTYEEGNLQVTSSSSYIDTAGTFAVDKGKWFWEFKCLSSATTNQAVGIVIASAAQNDYSFNASNQYRYQGNGFKNGTGGDFAYGDSYTTNDIIGTALDCDNGTLIFYKNGVSQGTAYTGLTNILFLPILVMYAASTSLSMQINFGNPPFTIASGNADANGYGNFEYAVPSGYYALCTKNLAQYG